MNIEINKSDLERVDACFKKHRDDDLEIIGRYDDKLVIHISSNDEYMLKQLDIENISYKKV